MADTGKSLNEYRAHKDSVVGLIEQAIHEPAHGPLCAEPCIQGAYTRYDEALAAFNTLENAGYEIVRKAYPE